MVLGAKDKLYYIRNWKSETPEIKNISTELGRQRKLTVSKPILNHEVSMECSLILG